MCEFGGGVVVAGGLVRYFVVGYLNLLRSFCIPFLLLLSPVGFSCWRFACGGEIYIVH